MTIMDGDDDDFLDEEDFIEEDEDDEKPLSKEKEKIEVEVKDETPDDDKGKWVADDERDGPPDEVPEDEIKNYSKQVQERIKKLTARMHAERRAREALAREHEEATRLISTYLNENNQLKDIVESGEKVLMNEQNARLQAGVDAIKQAWKKAYEAGDEEAMLAAQEKLAEYKAQQMTLANRRVQPLPRQEPPRQAPRPSEQAQRWHQRNPWFGQDPVMTTYAQALHKDLVERKGIIPDTEEYWGAIDKDVRQRFSDRFPGETKKEEPRRRRVPVANANRSSNTSSRKVTLTDSQVRLARRLGLTTEQYAEALLEQEQQNG